MNMNRARPPKGCQDLELWLSGTVWDAIKDCREAGLGARTVAMMMLSVAKSVAAEACLCRRDVVRALGAE